MTIDLGKLDGTRLSPSTMALVYVGYDAGDNAVLEVRRERRRFLRRWVVYSVLAALLLAVVPAVVVLGRTEPAYLTNWVLLVAGIAVILIVAAGTVGAWLWSRTPSGRRQFDAPVLTITSNGLVIPTRDGAVRAGWDRVTAARLYGHREVFLAIQVMPAPTEPAGPDPDVDPEYHADADADAAQHATAAFEDYPVTPVVDPESGAEIAPAPADQRGSHIGEPAQDAAEKADVPINADGHYTGGPAGAGAEQTPPVATPAPVAASVERADLGDAPLPDDRWAENLYGARFVIDLRECSPPISDICETIAAVTHGRLNPADA